VFLSRRGHDLLPRYLGFDQLFQLLGVPVFESGHVQRLRGIGLDQLLGLVQCFRIHVHLGHQIRNLGVQPDRGRAVQDEHLQQAARG
jgi:hypothetical protein